MRENAPAKINLGLHVLRRRLDGYHDIETVMLRLAWHDTIEATRNHSLALSCSDSDLPTDDSNLCLKAAKALTEAYSVTEGARLRLLKRIPCGAGLGGGSSDAASTMRLLVRLWGLPASDDDLATIGTRLGADIPFFLHPSPALAEGIGDRLSPLRGEDGEPLRLPFTFVVVKPQRSISTQEAYGRVTPTDEPRVDLIDLIHSRDLVRWRQELVNDFEQSVVPLAPEIRDIKASLYDLGAGYAAMSGSGSAVFGVFEAADAAARAAASFGERGLTCWAGRST